MVVGGRGREWELLMMFPQKGRVERRVYVLEEEKYKNLLF